MNKNVKIPRTWWSAAYLKEEEPGTFILYRDMLVEEIVDGKPMREKVGAPVQVGKPLREAMKGEESRVVVRSFHPTEQRPMDLVEVDP